MKTMTLAEFVKLLRMQGVSRSHIALVCPLCGTIQSMKDLVKAGAGKKMADVEKYFGFSCVGRFTGAGNPPKHLADKGKEQKGCNWTLGGLFQLHELEVVTPDGKHHPSFEPATPEQAKAHKENKP